jgi:hypothetical protein
MIQGKNFARRSTFTGDDVDTEYRNCNFSQAAPVDGVGGKEGVPLSFEGNALKFVECNLMNAQPPAGSIIERCNTTIQEFGIEIDSETVTIDGEDITVPQLANRIHGSLDPETLEPIYKPTPVDVLIDEVK